MPSHDSRKLKGQVWTPEWIVEKMLDDIGYSGSKVLSSSILEPSFGQGVFLEAVYRRIVSEAESAGFGMEETRRILEDRVYGIEMDEKVYGSTRRREERILSGMGFDGISLRNLIMGNALSVCAAFSGFFQYIVGNPPYIRRHLMDTSTASSIGCFSLSSGMTDVYSLFFEISIRMLDEKRKLSFITPNSYFTNRSEAALRDYLSENRMLVGLCDFKSRKVFENADTYTAITVLSKEKQDSFLWEDGSCPENPLFTPHRFGKVRFPVPRKALVHRSGRRHRIPGEDERKRADAFGKMGYKERGVDEP